MINAKKRAEKEELLFKIYVTDSLKMIAENTTHFLGPKEMFDYGSTFTRRWYEIAHAEPQKKETPEEPKTTKEIVSGIWARMRKKK